MAVWPVAFQHGISRNCEYSDSVMSATSTFHKPCAADAKFAADEKMNRHSGVILISTVEVIVAITVHGRVAGAVQDNAHKHTQRQPCLQGPYSVQGSKLSAMSMQKQYAIHTSTAVDISIQLQEISPSIDASSTHFPQPCYQGGTGRRRQARLPGWAALRALRPACLPAGLTYTDA